VVRPWPDWPDRRRQPCWIQFRLCIQVYKCQHSMAELCRPVSKIGGHQHLQSAGHRQLDVLQVRLSTHGGCLLYYDLQLRTLYLTLKKHFLCLLLDVSLNISTSHFTSTPNAFKVILQLMHYINYLLTSVHISYANHRMIYILILFFPYHIDRKHRTATQCAKCSFKVS